MISSQKKQSKEKSNTPLSPELKLGGKYIYGKIDTLKYHKLPFSRIHNITGSNLNERLANECCPELLRVFKSGIEPNLSEEIICIADITDFANRASALLGINKIYIKDIKIGLFVDKYCRSYSLPVTNNLTEQTSVSKRAPKGYVKAYLPYGVLLKREDASKIHGLWFQKSDLIEIDGVSYPNVGDRFETDFRTKKYTFKSNCFKVLVDRTTVAFTALDSTERQKIVECIDVETNKAYHALNEAEAIKFGYMEYLGDGRFYNVPQGTGKAKSFNRLNHIKKKIEVTSVIGDELKKRAYQYNYRFGTDSPTNLVTGGLPYTFGVEMECSEGMLPNWLVADNLNVKVVSDGSITGPEVVTGVLFGDSGFLMLKKICRELTKRCSVDDKTGLHVHIGGINFNKEFSIYMYILGMLIEDDLFSILPASRRRNTYCTDLPKDLFSASELRLLSSNSLPKDAYQILIDSMFERLFSHMTQGLPLGQENNRKVPHPRGHYAGGHSGARYHWLNLIVSNFVNKHTTESGEGNSLRSIREAIERGHMTINTRGGRRLVRRDSLSDLMPERPTIETKRNYTVEFRCHSGTLNYTKIRNWVMICMGLASFVENRKTLLLDHLKARKPLTLETIIHATYSKGSKEKTAMLIDYINKRKALFADVAKKHKENVMIDKDDSGKDNLLTLINEVKECA